MSNEVNDMLWDRVVDKALSDFSENAPDYEDLMSMDLEDAFAYLMAN